MLEKHFQSKVIKEIKKMFKGSIVLKTDPTYIQGIPDLLILYKKHWAALEVKQSPKAAHRPNQDYYVDYSGSGVRPGRIPGQGRGR